MTIKEATVLVKSYNAERRRFWDKNHQCILPLLSKWQVWDVEDFFHSSRTFLRSSNDIVSDTSQIITRPPGLFLAWLIKQHSGQKSSQMCDTTEYKNEILIH